MYIIDFFKNLFKKSNIGVIIWLVANILLLVVLFSSGFQSVPGAIFGVVLYALSMVIALSPIGEWILRLQTGCKKITDPEVLARIEPLFNEVYAKAKAENPELPDKIKMFMSDSDEPNAFATGRKTVCITRGLLTYSDEEIKGVLGHEFGHLAHKDTDIILVVAVGNLIVNAIFVAIRVIGNFFMLVGQFFTALFSENSGAFIANIFIGISRVVANFMLALLMRIWTQIGVWLCMSSSRKNEYKADEYSHNLGYREGLVNVLSSFGSSKSKGLFAALASSHPNTDDRIAKLQALPAPSSADDTAYLNQ